MNKKQLLVIGAPFVLIPFMYAVYQLLSREFGEALGWYLGFFPYWILWCGVFPLWVVGKDRLWLIIQPKPISRRAIALLSVPIIGAAAYKLVPGMDFGVDDNWLFLMMVTSAFGNGFFEEVLWRGVYMELFSENLFFRIIWPGILFALWHYAPGSVSSDGNVIALIVGSGMFGFYLGFLAWKTNTIWWSIVAHTVGGIIMVL